MILLTHGYFISDDEKEQRIMKPYVPLGLLYLSSYLESKSIAHKVCDTTFISFQQFTETLEHTRPNIIGIYTNLMTKLNVLKIIRFIKSNDILKQCKIILGGPEIRYNANNYLAHGADFLVIGEGEITFYELCAALLRNDNNWQTTHGIAYLNAGTTTFTPERALVKDINELPMPARHQIDLTLYGNAWKKAHGYSMYSISTMRGCPYTCKWCSRAVYGGTYRRRSPKLVVDEMQLLLQQYQPDRLWFVDDVFTISHKWLKAFHDELKARQIKIPYEIITRADRMNDEVIHLLKESGCFRVWIGAESGSQKIIDAMDRRVDVKMVREMIIKSKAQGLEAGTFIMLGYPGETKKDIALTIEHLQKSRPTFYTITLAYPITGTPLYLEEQQNIQVQQDWHMTTDRNSKLKRSQNEVYYNHALRWVNAEVLYEQTPWGKSKVKYKFKSIAAQFGMMLNSYGKA